MLTRAYRPSHSTSTHRPSAVAAALLLLASAGGCKLNEATVPNTAPRIVVHAVLNPFAVDEMVLVEQTLTGEVSVPDHAATDSLDPIATGGGVPIRDAVVIMRNLDDGQTAVGIEDASVRSDSRGKGMYRFQNRGTPRVPPVLGNEIPIARGARYELEVRWRGATVLARTTVPNPNEFLPQVLGTHEFNVDHDSLVMEWEDAQARRFVLLTETPYGPFQLFSARQRLVVHGGLRNLYVNELPPVFLPGFLEVVSTAAVDTNYFDYFRSFNNPFTGSGIINHVDGGVGVFGSIVPLDTRRLDVTADVDEPPIEGHFVGGASGADSLDLYLGETLGGGARRVSGTLRAAPNPFAYRRAIVGYTTGADRLSLAVLQGDAANDTLWTATGVAAGDSVVLSTRSDPTLVFRRTVAAAPAVAKLRAVAVVADVHDIHRLVPSRHADAAPAAGADSPERSHR